MDVRRAGWVVLFLLAGCTGGNELAVDVRTDLVPGVEFDGVRVTMEGQAPVERLARSGDDYGSPRRVAELTGLAPGRYAFEVELVEDGRPVLRRRVSVRLERNLIVVVVLSRDCRGVMCPRDGDDPTQTECLGGRCVDPQCSEVDPALCGDAECTGASDCAPSAACVMPACVEGACLELPSDALCTATEYCQPGAGCQPRPEDDAGMPLVDAGIDGGSDAGSGCVEGAPCDTGEPCAIGRVVCEDGAPRCAIDGPAPADTVCRPAAGPCDIAERCGGATTCPPDALAEAGVQCRASARQCDAAEQCTGASVECPADGASPDGTTCGGGVCSSGSCVPCSSGLPCSTGRACELGELDCSSGSPVCRSAGPRPAGTPCRDAVGPCDRAEQCNGSSLDCPADGFLGGSTTCRASIGPCDVADTCDGSGPACPADRFAGAGTTCRDAIGPCDVPDTCSGSSAVCGSDLRRGAGFVCRSAFDACDVPEVCDGSSTSCPSDGVAGAGSVCRPSAGVCDVPESCNGSSPSCPPDAFASAGTMCRAGSGVCNPAESCTGSSASCPADGFSPNGTVCGMESCGPFGACTGSGCDLSMGTQSATCSTPVCASGSCSGSTTRSTSQSCTRTAGCGDGCCNLSELGDTCPGDCGSSPVGISATGTSYTAVIGNSFGTSFEDLCPGDSVIGGVSLDYSTEHMRGMWSLCQDVVFTADRSSTPRYVVGLGAFRVLPERGGDGWATWDCPGDQVVTGFRAGTTTFSGRTVIDAIELRCSRMDAVGRTMPGVTFTYTLQGTELADDPFPPPATLTGPYDCPPGTVARGFRGSFSGSRAAPGALESFGLVCQSVVAR